MSIPRVKPADWGIGEKLTSAQQNELDTNVTYALDKRAGETDTLESVVTCAGEGRIIGSVAIGADADTTYLVSGANSTIRITTAVSIPRIYTLSATDALTGDIIYVYADSNFGLGVTIKDQAAATLFEIGYAADKDGSWASFIFLNSGWHLFQSAQGSRHRSDLFTSSGSWVCPRGVTEVLLLGVGAGGGGGGGGGNGASGTESGISGSGGGGALLGTVRVAVTPGTTYTVTIGAGGAAGTGGASGNNHGNDGNDGGDTIFGSTLATFYGAQGGHGGSYYGYGGTDIWPIGGGAVRASLRPSRVDDDVIHGNGPPREGQGGTGDGSGVGTAGYLQNGGGSSAGLGGAKGAVNGGGGGGASGWPGCVPGPGGTIGVGGTAGTLGAGGGGGAGAAGGAGVSGGAGGNGALRVVYVK